MIDPIYNDNSLVDCPLCNRRLTKVQLSICTGYFCYNHPGVFVNCRNIPHFSVYKYRKNALYMEYFIKPLYILTQSGATTLYLVSDNHVASLKELTTKPYSMFITGDDKEKTMKQLKKYLLFT